MLWHTEHWSGDGTTVGVPSPPLPQRLTATVIPTLAASFPFTHRLLLMLFIMYCTYNGEGREGGGVKQNFKVTKVEIFKIHTQV